MSNKRRWHINFGDTSPQVPRETELWVSTSDDNILRYNGSSWISVGGGGGASSNSPLIVSASPTNNIGSAGLQTTVNGLYFSEGANVKFIGTNNVEYSASQVTVVNTTKLIATQPALLVQHQPYDIKVINTDGSNYTIEDLLYVGNIPVWTTPSGNIGGTWSYNQFNSASVVATDADGHNISYEVTSGYSLPTGVSLNSNNGVISGTLSTLDNATYNFSIDAVDTVGNRSSRAFSIYYQGTIGRQQWTTVGTTSWTAPTTGTIKVLVVAGGGSGGYDVGGGGGGGGVIINNAYSVTAGQSYTVTVGAGGTSTGQYTSPSTQTSNNGGNSVFGSLTAIGGGKGGNYYAGAGSDGGSGGGGQGNGNGGAGTSGQGNNGGGYSFGSYTGSGAGGGAGAVGGNAYSSNGKIFGGTGGIGIQSNITGVNTYYGGGGGGGGTGNLTGSDYITSLGGLGGGGKGLSREPNITINSSNFPAIKAADMDALPNTGGGGGGTGGQTGGGNGGSGIVAIEYSLI